MGGRCDGWETRWVGDAMGGRRECHGWETRMGGRRVGDEMRENRRERDMGERDDEKKRK
jgi:hypothetical protein